MERTESTVVQVAPSFENDKIKEMEVFGWNLQSRQEIHEEGDAYGRPSYISSNTYVIKTTVSHYVKLHFVRSLGLPNLSKVRELESEYFNLPFPGSASLVGPIIFTILPILGFIPMLADPTGGPGSPGLFGLIVIIGWVFLGVRWIRSRQRENATASATRAASEKRAGEIIGEVRQLLRDSG